MQTISNMDWIINLKDMTCRNIDTDIVIIYERDGDDILGRIKELPNKIYEQWAYREDGAILFKQILKEAREIFLKVYIENWMTAN